MKIGIIAERKNPPDIRVPLSPDQCSKIKAKYPQIEFFIEKSSSRCFKDEEYEKQGFDLVDDVSMCDVLMGVKEVPVDCLIANKTYFFFSHTIKEQVYNRKLLQALVAKNIRMIDYETIKDEEGNRVIAFGRWAGIVGAHNTMYCYGKKNKLFNLSRLYTKLHFEDVQAEYKQVSLPPIKVVITGNGRVSNGSAEVMKLMNIEEVSPQDFLSRAHAKAVFTQLGVEDMYQLSGSNELDKNHFYRHPNEYKSIFKPYTQVADIMINGIYYDKRAPRFFEMEDIKNPDFSISVIGDITCDIAPEASVPTTIRPSTIVSPEYGISKTTLQECAADAPNCVTVMAVDNLPNELPRDASQNFGNMFIHEVVEHLVNNDERIKNAVVTEKGNLTTNFEYLRNYLNG